MLSFAETKVAILGSFALLGTSSSDLEGLDAWTLPTFAVALVAYLLWKGERQEKQQQKFREDSLKAQIHIKEALEDLREEVFERREWRRNSRDRKSGK